tara:strand:+ start:243 stop:944 length:702 start_codon:yes stop_codon:yes gene_type:complete
MAIDFKTPAEVVQNQGIKKVVYGYPGSGKTVLCTTTGAPTLMLSAEAGLLSIRDAKNVSVFEVTSLDQVKEAFKHLRDNPNEFEWVCLDSISEIAERILAEEMKATKDPRKAYGEMANKTIALIKAFRDLPMNVVFTAKLDRDKDDATGAMLYTAGAPGRQVATQLPYYVDIVCALRVIPNQEGVLERWLQTQQDGQWIAKDRSGKLAMWEEPNLAALKAKVIAKKPAVKKAA